MIISPPFLPSQAGHEMDTANPGDTLVPDHDVCAAGMQECAPGNGAYPVSYSLGWHGGPHLIAPSASNAQAEPVRAIADGMVVYVRKTSPQGAIALQYRNVRTDDGCVVIKHTTEIGEGESAKVTFFSIYMHLQSVVGAVVVGKPVYRKDKLGIAGQIYAQSGQMHFEIVCDEANLQKLVGRTTGPLIKPQGRKDAIYGDVWFKVPKGAKLFDKEPHPYRRDDGEPPLGPHPSVQRQQAIGVTGSDLVIRMHFERGDCALTTFALKQDGRCTQVGEPSSAHDYEYNMYSEAMRLNKKYSDGSTAPASPAPKAPSPSLIYEMLRFGRAVGETMPPDVKFGHWRKVVTPEGTGWINLNQATIGVYSDADFPQWAGWSLIDDDADATSLCTSPTVKRWLDRDGDGHVTHAEAKEALHDKTVAKRLSMAICKFPIEWSKDEGAINTRWGWVKQASEALPVPLSSADFEALKAHIQALGFWEDIHDNELPKANACWHFPPKAFVEQFRKCGWLSPSELAQCLPRKSLTGSIPWSVSVQRAATHVQPINLIYGKYLNNCKIRLIHFLAQTYIETGVLRTSTEDSKGAGHSYGAFYGRGYMQLTWASNYEAYGRYRHLLDQGTLAYADTRITATSTHIWADGGPSKRWAPRFDPSIVETDNSHGAEASGMYWLAKTFHGKNNINRAADHGATPLIVAFISWLVNGGGNGHANRQQFAALLAETLLDQPRRVSTEILKYPPLTPVGHPSLCTTFPPTEIATSLSVSVNYEQQVP